MAMTSIQAQSAKDLAYQLIQKASIAITPQERESMEIADFGLNDFDHQGLTIITYINNDRYCAKELILTPWQACPEHRHPARQSDPGKRETFRCRWGKVMLYLEGEPSTSFQGRPPQKNASYYIVRHEIILSPGEQFTINSNTKHWFQAGEQGAVISEFSSPSDDESDIFTDPAIIRTPIVEG